MRKSQSNAPWLYGLLSADHLCCYIGDEVVTQLGGQMQSIIPGMLVGLILMMLKVKETNGVDMGAVSAE